MSPIYPDEHPVHLARKAKGWRLEDLAARVGCSKPLLSNVERGFRPQEDRRLEIANALGEDVDALWPPSEIG